MVSVLSHISDAEEHIRGEALLDPKIPLLEGGHLDVWLNTSWRGLCSGRIRGKLNREGGRTRGGPQSDAVVQYARRCCNCIGLEYCTDVVKGIVVSSKAG